MPSCRSPLTSNGSSHWQIATRLPSFDFDDGNEHGASMPYLVELLSDNRDLAAQNPLTESIIFSTIWARATARHRQYLNGKGSKDSFWNEVQSLAKTCRRCSELFTKSYATSTIRADPLLLFTSLMSQCITIKLGQMAELAPWGTGNMWQQDAVSEYKEQAREAAEAIVKMSSSLSQLNALKVSHSGRTHYHPVIGIRDIEFLQ